jgi:hypothetical protein
MTCFRSFFSSFLLFLPVYLIAQNTGVINGKVRDVRTLLPISGAVVQLVGSEIKTTTDDKGYYRITYIPTRTWNLEAKSAGYRTDIKYDLVVTTGNALEINFELEVQAKELDNIIIKPGFLKPVGVVNSVQTLGTAEIAKYPGANFDIAKVVQSLPGVLEMISSSEEARPMRIVIFLMVLKFRRLITLLHKEQQADRWVC